MTRQHIIAIVAAGTGGHVMPGLALAEELRNRAWSAQWVGTRIGMERSLVEASEIPFHALDFSNMRGKGLLAKMTGAWRLLKATRQCVTIFRQSGANAVLATGGYVAVPAGLAAAWLGIPFYFLNADAAPQLSLRLLRPFVRTCLCGFDGEAARLLGARALVCGAPVRQAMLALPQPEVRMAGRQGPLRIFVAGGSLGAGVLNRVVPFALANLPSDQRPVVFHQCGARHLEETRQTYVRLGVDAQVEPFVTDMATRYADADLVICRAGAITVSELCAVGVASILVPLIAATTAHQSGNAAFMENHGAGIHLPENELNPHALTATLQTLTRNGLQQMAVSARRLARANAAGQIADHIEHTANLAP
jgi:UDP-N-acetylglucosamine--N-acetylmuramyl-(pentapeptide) pyrophosphoryl-undecaprenol N-acetylglucosamine transferase